MEAFLSRVMKSFSEISKKKNITIVLDNEVGGLEFLTDQSLLEQVIDNLISNAIKFSSSDKMVWLRAKKNDSHLMIEVEDQGPGIKPEELPKLFGTFQRLSTKPTGWRGIHRAGLSIVKAIVKVLDGEVRASSELGRGTIFTVLLKLKK